MVDPRRRTPRTDTVLDAPDVRAACTRLGRARVKATVGEVLEACRQGRVDPDDVLPVVLASLPPAGASLRRVFNATGIVVRTNLGRAPLSASAVEAVTRGRRGGRRRPRPRPPAGHAYTALAVLRPRPCRDAGGVHVVMTERRASPSSPAPGVGREVVVARGEFVEIGDGFRVPELVESVGGRLREVGTTNRVRLEDYRGVVGDQTAFVLKVHPSNFRVEGFTSTVAVGDSRRSAPWRWPTSARPLAPIRGCRRARRGVVPPRGATLVTAPATSCSAARSPGAARRRRPRAAAAATSVRPRPARRQADPRRARGHADRAGDPGLGVARHQSGGPPPPRGAAGGGDRRAGPRGPVDGGRRRWRSTRRGAAERRHRPSRPVGRRLRQGVVPVVGHVGDGVLLLDLIGVPEESDAAVADAVRAALDQDA